MFSEIEKQTDNLKIYGITEPMLNLLWAGGAYLQSMGGTPLRTYWLNDNFDNRDEFFLLANASTALTHLIQTFEPKNEWRLEFDVAYLYNLKANIQSIVSVDTLAKLNCYSDAFSICRTMHSRLNLLLLCSLNTSLFNRWLNNPKSEIFIDGHVRKELDNNKIPTMEHMYELGSEIVHGHFLGLGNIGYMEKGLFVDISAIKNQLYVTAKFILGAISYSMLSMIIADIGFDGLPEEVNRMDDLFNIFIEKTLAYNRIDHLMTIIGEERHWGKVGKDTYEIGGGFDYQAYRDQIEKFHRKSGQRKQLSKKYR